MNTTDIISAVQAALNIQVDGKAGPETWTSIYKKIIGVLPPSGEPQRIDARSEAIIATLLPEVRPYARTLVQKAATVGIDIKIISGFRSYAEQDALYAQGRTKAGPIVTNAKGGHSNHNFGIAFDVGVFEGDRYLGESKKYKTVGILGMDIGLDWGGNWETIVDQPHFQLRPMWATDLSEAQMLAELRSRKETDSSVYA
jgi:peptidoglycan L-alanyl-D-glutamate endopeptidase CwlK